VAGVLDDEAVEHVAVGTNQRKLIEHANRARMSVEHLTEVRFAQPSVDVRAHLDAHLFWYDRRSATAVREIDLAEPALSEQPFDAVLQLRIRTGDELGRTQQKSRASEATAEREHRARRGGSRMIHERSA